MNAVRIMKTVLAFIDEHGRHAHPKSLFKRIRQWTSLPTSNNFWKSIACLAFKQRMGQTVTAWMHETAQ